MQKKNIFKALAAAMLMPAMLLTTACSNQDDVANINNEPTVKKGYALPVTVNVTRQGDATTRATYTDNGDKTGSLAFSAGDKLFVNGNDNSANGAGQFAGTLDYVPATGKFSGTIYTQNSYSGTADALFTAASAGEAIDATLLPYGYDSYTFLSILEESSALYDDRVDASGSNAFVASETAKATGVEQLSYERATTYSSGFALAPVCAILNFTISGLEAGAQDVTLYVTRMGAEYDVTGSVTPNASGVATFAIGVPGGFSIKDVSMSNNLSVGSHKFTLPGGTALTAGKIYNITRSAAPAPSYTMAAAATTSDKGKLICADGHIHANGADAACTKARVAKIIYIGTTGHDTYTHGLALALTDEGQMAWQAAIDACSAKNTSTPVTGATWLLASQDQWNYMMGANGAGSYTDLRTGFSGITGADNLQSGDYWSSKELDSISAWRYDFKNGYWYYGSKGGGGIWVRACLAF